MKLKTFLGSIFLVFVLLTALIMPVAAATVGQAAQPPTDPGLSNLLTQWGGLVGFAALIAFLINVLKTFGVIKNGDAPTWSAGFNLLGLIGLLALKIFKPDLDVTQVDAQVQGFVQVGIVVLGYVVMLLGSKLTHLSLAGIPVIGKSFTLESAKPAPKPMEEIG